MTKRRDPLSYHTAGATIVELIGWKGVCAATGRSDRSVRKWLEPDVAPHLPLPAALALDLAYQAAGGDHAPFQAWYQLQMDLAAAAAALSGQDGAVIERIADAQREVGEAFAALIEAILPDAPANARHIAARETAEAIVALSRTLPRGAGR